MGEKCKSSVGQLLQLSQELLELADKAECESMDEGCYVLFGVVRDCAHKMIREAQRECEEHLTKGLCDHGPVRQNQEG